jgi:hypothetical protein
MLRVRGVLKTDAAARIVLGVAGAGAVAALCYTFVDVNSLVHWSWTAPGQSSDLRRLILVALAVFFFASMALPRSWRRVMAGSSVSLAVLVYSAELVLTGGGVALSINRPLWSIDRATAREKHALTARFGMAVDPREHDELIGDLRQRGRDAVPAIMIGDLLGEAAAVRPYDSLDVEQFMPLGGVSRTLTVLCNETQYVSYTSDEHGFRNPPEIWRAKRADIAAVGESLVQGYCVPEGRTIVDLLRSDGRIVFNLGVSGESSLLQLAAIKEYLPPYAPPVVLWFFSEGIDLPDLYTESRNPFLMRYLDPDFTQDLTARQTEIDESLRRVVADMEERRRREKNAAKASWLRENAVGILKLWHLREAVYDVSRREYEAPRVWSMLEQDSRNLLGNVLSLSQRTVKSWGGTLYFVYLPSWERFHHAPAGADREHREVLRLVGTLGIPVIDMTSAFARHGDPLSLFPYRSFGHYNEQGNRVVADTVLQALSGRAVARSEAHGS